MSKSDKRRRTPTRDRHAVGISSAAVEKRTGHGWKRWFAILDRAGAKRMSHREIVAHLAGRHNVRPWWRQMVTVAYERERGLRVKHQTATGFSISRSKTIAASPAAVFAVWHDPRRRRGWLSAEGLTIRKATPHKSLRITWVDGETSVEVMFYPKGAGKTQVSVQHSKLPDAKAGARMKRYWGAALERMSRSSAGASRAGGKRLTVPTRGARGS